MVYTEVEKIFLLSLPRYDDDANDDPDYQQPASMSQKDEDMDDEDDKVTLIFCFLDVEPFTMKCRGCMGNCLKCL